MPDVAPGESQSVSHKMALSLRADILSGAIPIGARIAGEHELMARFSVSRQTVREALRDLSAAGLVHSRRGPNGGAFVAAPDLRRMADLIGGAGQMIAAAGSFRYEEICRAIYEIEGGLARLAVERRDPEAIEAMKQAIAGISDAPSTAENFFAQHMAFSRSLWKAGGNGPLVFIMEAFMQFMHGAIPPADRDIGQMLADHAKFLRGNYQDILAAIEAGDRGLIEKAMLDNFRFWMVNTPLKA